MDPFGPVGYTVIMPDGSRYGPVDAAATLRSWVSQGRVAPGTSIEDPISGQIRYASTMPEVADLFVASPPPMSPAPRSHAGNEPIGYVLGPATPSYGTPPKQKWVAILLAFFLGGLGVHRFYLGHNGTGIAMLLITVLTCGYGACITLPWLLIDIILIATGSLREANGRELA
ncbi:MAG: hypothetical protein C4320_02930 [Armatimonadota bacterium]